MRDYDKAYVQQWIKDSLAPEEEYNKGEIFYNFCVYVFVTLFGHNYWTDFYMYLRNNLDYLKI